MKRFGIRRAFGGGNRVAFTLAEVLITLGIIGVVAAITLPTLIKNYKNQVYVTLLKQDVSILENSFKRILADNETDNLDNTPLYDGTKSLYDRTKFSKDYFISQTKFNDISNNSTIEFVKSVKKHDRNASMFYLNNGSCIAVESRQRNKKQYLYIDVNCDKSPNKIGYDQFIAGFRLLGNVDISGIGFCPKDVLNGNDDVSFESPADIARMFGEGCFLKIVRDGWKMNYED